MYYINKWFTVNMTQLVLSFHKRDLFNTFYNMLIVVTKILHSHSQNERYDYFPFSVAVAIIILLAEMWTYFIVGNRFSIGSYKAPRFFSNFGIHVHLSNINLEWKIQFYVEFITEYKHWQLCWMNICVS